MTFWSGDRLLRDGKQVDLVTPFDDKLIDCSAYTLRLGHESFVTPQFGEAGPNIKQQLAEAGEIDIAGIKMPVSGGELVIPAGQFAFLLTHEVVKIPAGCMGFISLKSKLKWNGLINVSGFHVDPGFHGRLVYSVYNAGPSNIHVRRGEKLFLLWIADLDTATAPGANRFIKTNNEPLVEIPTDLVSRVDRPLHSLQSLSEKVEALQRELSMIHRVMAALAVIAGLILAAWALLPSADGQSNSGSAIEVS
ncbi:dCTP deaminase domain-containing protein [Novosphingobium kaempferiae]|uniref:dCTP deaminase domain-containing protein n=1 Tax=Novosphingobium kaempferiae TaxID=2896849 RepID=UPI001E421864|nr:hypothetical protein [Novosphingobium kaempferiae]